MFCFAKPASPSPSPSRYTHDLHHAHHLHHGCCCALAGAIHTVENTYDGESKFLQIFDHPQAGAVFVASAMAALPASLINSAFSADVLTGPRTGNPGIIMVRDCGY